MLFSQISNGEDLSAGLLEYGVFWMQDSSDSVALNCLDVSIKLSSFPKRSPCVTNYEDQSIFSI